MKRNRRHNQRRDKTSGGQRPRAMDKHKDTGDTGQQSEQEGKYADRDIQPPSIHRGFSAFIDWFQQWQRWDRDDVEVLFSGVVAMTAMVGAVGLLFTWYWTQQGLTETRKATEVAETAVAVARDQIRLEQRAFVYVSSFVLTAEPTEQAPNPRIRITPINKGRTSAHRVMNQPQLTYSQTTPSAPEWSKIAPGGPYVLHPDIEGYSVEYDFGKAASNDPAFFESVRVYRAKQTKLFVRLRIDYLDWYDNPHWVEACVYREFGWPLNFFQLCSEGNDFDKQ